MQVLNNLTEIDFYGGVIFLTEPKQAITLKLGIVLLVQLLEVI
jgi:hypothetical protein